MKYFWGLTHLLQLLRVIVLVNITVPKFVVLLCSYFRIAIGEFDIIQEILPSIVQEFLVSVSEKHVRVP